MNWIKAPSNTGNSGNSFSLGGIPSDLPIWNCSYKNKIVNFMTKVLAKDNYLYFNENGSIVCRALDTGKVIWECKHNGEHDFLLQFAFVGDYLYSQGALFNLKSGEKIHDFLEFITPRPKYDLGVQIHDNQILLEENSAFLKDGTESRTFLFDTSLLKTSQLELDISWVRFDIQNDQMYGWQDDGYLLKCINRDTNNFIWEISLDYIFKDNYYGHSKKMLPELFQINKFIYLMSSGFSAICCIDSETGMIVWEHSIVNDYEHLQGTLYRPAISENFICFAFINKSNGKYNYISLDARTGKTIWCKSYKQIGFLKYNPVISGDLIFHGMDFDTHTQTQLVAIDIYNGDIVWRAKDTMTSAYHLIVHKNKIIYTSTIGEISCFEWEKEYISPYREMTIEELITNNTVVQFDRDTKRAQDKSLIRKSWFKKYFD